jgi:glycosyltransferase involved in cell wall biosynthesis
MPVHNGGDWLQEALSSLWAQDDANFDVVVVDDGSTDDTPAILAAQDDPRLTVIRNASAGGQARATNQAVVGARGDFIKLLHADDRLAPSCIRAMREFMEAHPTTGLVCSARNVIVDDPGTEYARAWLDRFSDLHRYWRRPPADEVISGCDLLLELIEPGILGNWLAEPSGVMLRRSVLEQAGGMHLWLRGWNDIEWWARVAARSDVGFLSAALYDYRFSDAGVTASALRDEAPWIGPIWVCDSLVHSPDAAVARSAARLRRRLLRRAILEIGFDFVRIRHARARSKSARLREYAQARIAVTRGTARLFESIQPVEVSRAQPR